jgi:hypothetical protein
MWTTSTTKKIEKEKEMSDIEYLAIPYSDPDPAVMDYRAEVSDIVCADLMNNGRIIFAPISSCHHIAKKYDMPRDWPFWKRVDEQFVRASKTILVVALPGWEVSTGVTAERKIAEEAGIPMELIDPTPYLEKLNGGKSDK